MIVIAAVVLAGCVLTGCTAAGGDTARAGQGSEAQGYGAGDSTTTAGGDLDPAGQGPEAQGAGAQGGEAQGGGAQGYGAGDGTAAAGGIPVLTERIPEARNIEARACGDPAKTGAAMAILDTAVSRFPQGLQARAGIEAIFICEGLTSFGIPVPAASARIEGKTCVYVDASAPRRIDVSFTHELFHAIEFERPVDADAWAQINPLETYPFDTAQPGEVFRYNPNMIPAFEPGFVSDYARFSGMEDRAELFAALYSGRALSASERTAMLSDAFLTEKIAFLKEYLDKAGLATKGLRDNLYPGEPDETRCFCRAFALLKPELARTGPDEAYPRAGLEAGQLLADSGFEKDGLRMLYDCTGGLSRVYAPPSALEPLDGETFEIVLPQEPGAKCVSHLKM